MNDLKTALAALQRPSLLIRAARFGLPDYVRDRDLRKLTGLDRPLSPNAALPLLIKKEAELDAARKSGTARYSVAKQVALLTALMAEANLLPG